MVRWYISIGIYRFSISPPPAHSRLQPHHLPEGTVFCKIRESGRKTRDRREGGETREGGSRRMTSNVYINAARRAAATAVAAVSAPTS